MANEEKSFGSYAIKTIISLCVMIFCFFLTDNCLKNTSFYITLTKTLPIFSTFLDMIISGILTVVINVFIYFPELLLPIRKHFLPVANFEGDWIEDCIHPTRSISICKIYYNRQKRRHSYKGASYSEKGELVAHWQANHVSFLDNDGTRQLSFLGTGEKTIDGTSMPVYTTGVLYFYSHDSKDNRYTEGNGYYVDHSATKSDNALEQIDFKLTKISRDMRKKYCPKGKLDNPNDKSRFVVNYVRDRANAK